MWEAILGGLATVAGAYFGSAAAFRFNRQQHESEKLATQVEECNRTVLLLSLQYSLLENYQRQRMQEHEASAGRHLLLRANAEFKVEHLRINAAALSFLLATEARDVPPETAILNDRFMNCIVVVNERSRIHIDQYQPALEAALQSKQTTFLPGGEVEKLVGPRITHTLESLTTDIYERVPETMAAIAAAVNLFHAKLTKIYPGQPLIKFQPKLMESVLLT